ncbi:MAG: hypothetical protein D6160_02295 [Ketobacter sp.]|nr:MAG: hypothetical protein D6160_02295 [Ketobacter sp.]
MHCLSCGSDNPAFHTFCYHCGAVLNPSQEAGEQATPAPNTRDLMPELKKVSILFVDITNSVHLIHKLKPEESTDYLDPTITSLKQCAHRYGGMINRVDGDGMMVIFGAPVSYEDHATRACYAGLDMLYAVQAEFEQTQIAVRIGIHSGEVLMKPFYNDFSVDYEALGPTVYLAHRMEVLAPPNSAIISRETFNLAKKSIKVLDQGLTNIKGLEQPVEVYQLQGKIYQTDGEKRLLDDSPFIGREQELTQLYKYLRDAPLPQGHCVAICADPGVGKSRLLSQFEQIIDLQQFQVLRSGCDSHNRHASYLPFSNLLRNWLNVLETDTQLQIAQKLRDRIRVYGDVLSASLSAFHFLLDLPIQNKSWNSLEPVQKRQQARDAFRTLLGIIADACPLVIVLEDLHWIDAESQTLLEQIAEVVNDHPLFLIVTFRPEYQSPWLENNAVIIELNPFTAHESNDYLQGVLGTDPGIVPLCDEISVRCEGNPLYIEEMIHHLMDSNLIWGGPGKYSSTLATLPKSLPLTIHSVIATRIDRRSKLAKNILQAASAVGQRFSSVLLDYITDIPRDYAKRAIDELIESGLIVSLGDSPTDDFEFKHALVHQVTYDTIPRERKRLTHASLVNAMESLYKERLEEHIYRLAEHAYLGQYWHKAVEYYLKSCYHAIGRSSHQQAVLLLDRGLEALRHLPLNNDTLGQRIDFLAVGMNALIPLGEQDRLVRDLREAEKLCDAVGEPRRTCSILCQLSNALWMVGEHPEALDASLRAVALTHEIDHTPLRIAANYNLAMVHHAMGNFDDCIALEKTIVSALSGDMEVSRLGWTGYPSVFCRTFYGNSLVELGRLAEAKQVIGRGIEIAEGAQHPYSQAMIYDTHGYYLLAIGEFEKAREILQLALRICEEYAILTMVPAVSAKLAEALVGCNKMTQSAQLLEQALQPACYRKGGRYTWFYLYKAMTDLQLNLNEPDKALGYAKKAFTLTRETNEKAHHGWSSLQLAKVQATLNQSVHSIQLVDIALDIANQKRMALLGYRASAFACEMQFRNNQPDTSLTYLDMAHSYAQRIDHPYYFEHFNLLKRLTGSLTT